MTTLATLTVDLMADSAKFRNEMKKANKSSKSWADGVRKSAKVAGAAIAAAAVAAAGALAKTYSQQSKLIDQQAKFADSVGMSTEALSGFRHAGELTGVSQAKMDSSLMRMVKRLGEAENGLGAAKTTLEQLGLSNQAFFDLSPETQFKVIAEEINKIDSAQGKAAATAAIFGREGVALVNTLAMGADGLTAMQQEAESLGISLNRVDAAKIEMANDQMYRVGQLSKGAGMQITAELAPIVEGLATEWLRAAQEAGGMGNVIGKVVNYGVGAVGHVANAVRGISVAWEVVQAASASAVKYILKGLVWLDRGITDFINKIPGLSAGYSQELATMADAFTMMADDAWQEAHDLAMQPLPSDSIKQWVADVQSAATARAEANVQNLAAEQEYQTALLEIKTEAAEQQKRIEEEKSAAATEADQKSKKANKDSQNLLLKNAGATFDQMASLTQQFAGKQDGIYRVMFAASKAFAVADSVVKIQQGVAQAASLPWPANLGAMASVIAATSSIVSTISGASYNGAAPRALGGSVSAGQTYLVGERGPELLTMNPNGTGSMTPTHQTQQQPAPQPAPAPEVNVNPVLVLDSKMITDVLESPEGERAVMNITRRNKA